MRSPETGFTLLELVISITLLGIIVLIVAGAMRLGFSSVDAGEKKVQSMERIRTSLSVINSQVQSEIPLTFDDDGSRKFFFTGRRDLMEFATNYSLSGVGRGYVVASYRVAPDTGGKQVLFLTENGVGMENRIETKLLDSFDEVYFEYFYKEPTQEQGGWVTEWSDETVMPEKIRVHLVEGSNDLALIIPMRSKGLLAQTPAAAPARARAKDEE